ncbi:uncharacterized protein LOC132259287 [Phlebotomus argentipes]|uniref:uncharacterized protein LOC132259287 n=1 Tax=Phlebotomus argentipes TaxID=94469 RepID=UPI002892B459|nr:uncharacterized protein LOC132259287 [Phlebotomus argentipes]
MLRACLSQNPVGKNHSMEKLPFVKQEIAEVCRICETMENLLDISTEEFSHLNEKLHRIADFEDDYSSFLKFICISCGTKLENAFDFKIQCEDTYRKLVDQMDNSIFQDSLFSNSGSDDLDHSGSNRNFTDAHRDKSFFEIYEVVELEANTNDTKTMAQNQIKNMRQQQFNTQKTSNSSKNFSSGANQGGGFMKMLNVRRTEKAKASFVCAMCDETFKEKWKMREHMQRVHLIRRRPIYDNGDRKATVGQAAFRHPPTPIEKKFPCNNCGRLFRTKAYLEIHSQEHGASKLRSLLHESTSRGYNAAADAYGSADQEEEHGEAKYTCHLCDKSFQRRQGLRVHYQIHTDERPYPCTYCEKAFRCRSHLNRHIYTHTGEKKYKCQVCQKCFTQSGSLRIHMRIHTGELPYECPNCLTRFRVRKTLLNHRKRCLPVKQERYKSLFTVLREFSLLSELLRTAGALKGVLARVDAHVDGECAGLHEGFAALQALVGLFAGVRLQVSAEVCAVAEGVGADVAGEGALAGVHSVVLVQVLLSEEALAALLAFVWLLAVVDLHVLHVLQRVLGLMAADLALERLRLGAERHHMHLPVGLHVCLRTKRLAAEVAGECFGAVHLPVPHHRHIVRVFGATDIALVSLAVTNAPFGSSAISATPTFAITSSSELTLTSHSMGKVSISLALSLISVHLWNFSDSSKSPQSDESESKLIVSPSCCGCFITFSSSKYICSFSTSRSSSASPAGSAASDLCFMLQVTHMNCNQVLTNFMPDLCVNWTESSAKPPLLQSTISSIEGFMDKQLCAKQDVLELCRICERMDNLLNISTEKFSHLNEKLHQIADFGGNYSYMLNFICTRCSARLEDAFDFKIQCENTYKILICRMGTHRAHPLSVDPLSELKSVKTERPEEKSDPEKMRIKTWVEKSEKTPDNTGFVIREKLRFACADCGKRFKKKCLVRNHIFRAHVKDMPFGCEVCNLRFSLESSLKAHRRLHCDSQVPCDVCGKTFKNLSYMRGHRRKVHSKPPRPQINPGTVCQTCDFHAKNRTTLLAHLKRHTGELRFKCDVCDKRFLRKMQLKRHLTIHTGERPYMCHICSKAFKVRPNLNSHMMSHSGEKKYKCKFCEKSYQQSYALKVHMQRDHLDEPRYECPKCLAKFRQKKIRTIHAKTCRGEPPKEPRTLEDLGNRS